MKQTKISSFRYNEFWMDCALPELLEACRCNYINDEEARQLSGEYSLLKLLKSSYGTKYVVIKKGEHGALLFQSNVFCASIAIRRSFDPTGAGDTCRRICRIYYKAKTFI
jgi:sugar/nucleoside kinase (ribokinase family)